MTLSYILKALAQTGVDIIGPGVSEIAYGADRLRKNLGGSDIQLVSANASGFAPYALLTKNHGQTRILVTSVVDPEMLAKRGMDTGEILDPAAALSAVKREIHHDLFIVIIHANREKINDILRACPGIDLVIDAVSSDFPGKARTAGTPVVSNNQEGMFVSYIDYQGENFLSPVSLKADVGKVTEDAGVKALLGEYENLRAKHLSKNSGNRPAAPQEGSGPEDNASPYVGSHSCNFCHTEINSQWSETPHAGAMHSLVAKSKENDPNCLSCHVTGLEEKYPERNFSGVSEFPPFMTGVQCEACHGPGAAHARDPMGVDMEAATENTCMRCHTGRTDPDFDYDRDVFRVNHGRFKMGYQAP